MRVNGLEHVSIHETLNSLVGGQEAILGLLRDQGRLLGSHTARFDAIDARLEQVEGKLDIALAWIDLQPWNAERPGRYADPSVRVLPTGARRSGRGP